MNPLIPALLNAFIIVSGLCFISNHWIFGIVFIILAGTVIQKGE